MTILLIGNDVEFLESIKGCLKGVFQRKTWIKATYILGIKIYRDRSRRPMIFSKNTHLDMILKEFKIDQSKKEFLPELQGVSIE